MEVASRPKSKEKDAGHPVVITDAESEFSRSNEFGVAAGLPLFLGASGLSSAGSGMIQRTTDNDAAPDEEEIDPEEEPEEITVRTKLAVGQPRDSYEQEADRVAQLAVLSTPASGTLGKHKEQVPGVQRKAAEGIGLAPAAVPAQLLASTGSGAPLNQSIRDRVEPLLGADLSQVRVHSDDRANAAAKNLQAKAFTHRNHIWLGASQSPDDLGLMAHEATHVAQQSGAARGPVPPLQRRQESGADAESTEQLDAGANQGFGFSEEEMESRLSRTPPGGADTSTQDADLNSTTESRLQEVESEEGDEEQTEEAPAEEEAEEGQNGETRREERGPTRGALRTGGRQAQASMETPGPATEFENLVSAEVAAYLEGNLSEERLAQLDPMTQQLLEGAAVLSEQMVVSPEGLTGPDAAAEISAEPQPYAEDEPWLQVVAQIRDVTSSLGGIVGIIGLVATVSGLILSLLVPPVGAFLLTVGRFCDIVALVLDAISLVLSGILLGYNLYRLKNTTDPEEKRRLLGLVRQEGMNTFMSAVAVATAVAPGAARALGRTRAGQAVGRGLRSLGTRAGRGLTTAGRAVAGSRIAQRLAGSAVGRGAAGVGRGFAAVGRGVTGLGRGAVTRGREFLIRLRDAGPVRWANRFFGQLDDRARDYFRNLATRNTRFSRFYNRRLRGFHERNVRVAQSINDPIERAYHERLGRRLRDRLDELQGQGITDVNQLNTQLRQEFGDRYGHAEVGRSEAGNIQFVRDDNEVLRSVREQEFTELQLIRDAHPNVTPAQLKELVDRNPFIRGQWTQSELQAFQNLRPDVRRSSGALVTGAVPKTGHHTIPAQMAPQIHRDPRFIQMVNDSRFYQNFINQAHPGLQQMPDPSTVRVPGARPGQTRQAGNLIEATEGMVDSGDFTVPSRNFFTSDQFVAELREQGSTGVWINPRNPAERYFFNPHQVIGHAWNWRTEVARQIFDLNARLGLRGEPIRQLLAPALRQAARETQAFNGDSGQDAQTPQIASLLDQALMARTRLAAGGSNGAGAIPEVFVTPVAQPVAGSQAQGDRSGEFAARARVLMITPLVRLAGAPAPAIPASAAFAPTQPSSTQPTMPEPPPSPVPYSPQSLMQVRESRLAVLDAIQAVEAYIADASQAELENTAAAQAAAQVQARSASEQSTVETERADIESQQGSLDQSEGAQQSMVEENARASGESDGARSEGEGVQGEGANVSVEPREEEPESKSWLERAWDATAGALWENLIAPAVRAVRRKFNEIMQQINEFIMGIINQALGLDEIEAELDSGGQDIQDRRASLQESDTGLTEAGAQAEESQASAEESQAQAEANVEEASALRAQAEELLAALIAHHDMLLQEEELGRTYVTTFGAQYQEYFASERQLSFAEMAIAASGASQPVSSDTEEMTGVSHVAPVLSYIGNVEAASASALTQVTALASESGGAIPAELSVDERAATSVALAAFSAGHARCDARLAALRGEAEACVGLPLLQAEIRLQRIVDELLALADEIERQRQQAIQTIAEPHAAASAGDAGESADRAVT